MQHFLHLNYGIVLGRQGSATGSDYWDVLFICNSFIDQNIFRRGGGTVFPLYLYPDTEKPEELQQEKRPNFSQDFLDKIESKLSYLPTPEAIFYYIYAIFHSPTYRSRYAEFLKIDFPRVPLTSNNQLFTELSALGEQLVQLHLMTSPTLTPNPSLTSPPTPLLEERGVRRGEIEFIENGGNREVKIPSAKTAWQDGIVKLNSDDDILHYQKIVIALSETIKLMTLIDETIPSFPIE
jgi:hypothetical protein